MSVAPTTASTSLRSIAGPGTDVVDVPRTSISASDLAVLYEEHWASMVRTATWLSGDPSLAEEVVQDAFIRLVEHWPTLREPEAVGGWLRTTVVNLCRTRLRRRSLGRRKLAQVAAQHSDRHQIDPGERLHEGPLGAAIRALPVRQRECVVLRFVHDLTVPQLAEALDISPGTAKTHLHRALRSLETALDERSSTEEASP